ncbi:MAG TPA: SDR family NAD(P)-dependent oxidoreductase [Candidatus Blautia faecipullorum]|nr:SDR family NAD(P)-dependent oxidoreductase [Candidatus Blautia faecipullorum]
MADKELLKGKVAIVTGSGQGVGRALAIALADHGAMVVTNNRRPGSTGNAMLTEDQYDRLSDEKKEWYDRVQKELNGDAETTAQTIRRRGGEATACFADISKFDEADRLIQTAVNTYGGVDILCNVAGAFGICDIDQISEELWNKVTDIKPKGYFHTMRFAIPHMKKKHFGRIINCTSRAFMGDVIKHAEYCAANAGVVGLTRGAAVELREYGITCNAFGPFAKTRAAYELEALSLASEKTVHSEGMGKIPTFEQTPDPCMIVPFLLYLASDYGEKISGSVFTLSGNTIQLHQEPVVCRMLEKFGTEPWTVEEIVRSAPRSLLKNYQSIADGIL